MTKSALTLTLGGLFDKVHAAQAQSTLGGPGVEPRHKAVGNVVVHALGGGLHRHLVATATGPVGRDGLGGGGAHQSGDCGALCIRRQGSVVARSLLQRAFQLQHWKRVQHTKLQTVSKCRGAGGMRGWGDGGLKGRESI